MDYGTPIDLEDADSVRQWQEHFGVTKPQLDEAVLAAGTDPKAIREHLLNQGSSAGAS